MSSDQPSADELRRRFAELHARPDVFVMPNPWDVGSARILVSVGFESLATTSSGYAASLGRRDQHVTRDELLAHVAALTSAVPVPLNVDTERGFADDATGVAETVRLVADAGAAGCSIEDYDPAANVIDPVEIAAERVAAAATEARRHGMMLTGRAENHLHGIDDLDDTIARLVAYRDAGADVVYAPGLAELDDIARVVTEVRRPVNVLALRGGPSVAELGSVGVRRVSVGGALAFAAYGALHRAASELLDAGTSDYTTGRLAPDAAAAAFGP